MTLWAKFLRLLSPSLDRELNDRWRRANTAEVKMEGYRQQLIENGIEPTCVFKVGDCGVMIEMTYTQEEA